MKLEQKYLVVKIEDIHLLPSMWQERLWDSFNLCHQARHEAGERPLKTLVIEKHQPEYKHALSMLSERADRRKRKTRSEK